MVKRNVGEKEVRSKKPRFKRSEGTIEKVSDVFNFSSIVPNIFIVFANSKLP